MTSFSILSYNVNFGPFMDVPGDDYHTLEQIMKYPSVSLVLDAIAKADADLVLLQETNEGWEYACSSLKGQYPHQCFYNALNGYYAAGSAVLFKDNFKLTDLKAHDPGVKGGFFASLIVSGTFTHGQTVHIVNAHLRPPLAMGDEGNGLWANIDAYFRTSGTIHKNEIKSHLKLIESETKTPISKMTNTFVVGDFNEGSLGDGYKYLKAKGFTDAVAICSDETTWYWPVPVIGNIWGAYDHIFYPAGSYSVERCEVMRGAYKNASDHCPVYAVLKPTGN